MSHLQDLLEWAAAGGATIDSAIKFETTPSAGVTARLTSEIRDPSALIKIPRGLLLTPADAESFFGDAWKGPTEKNEQLQLLLAKLKFDNAAETILPNGTNLSAKFKPYLDYLPSRSDLPYFWSEAEKEALTGTDADVFLKRYMDALVNEWHESVSALSVVSSFSGLSDDDEKFFLDYTAGHYNKGMGVLLSLPITRWTSFPAYLWSYCVFASRGFPYTLISSAAKDRFKAIIVPVVDLLNHSNEGKPHWSYQNDSFVFGSEQSPLTEGTELFNHYGNKSNTELLLGYGFILPDNEFDKTFLTLKVPKETVAGARKFVNNFPKDASEDGINFELTRADPLPENLVDFFAFLVKLPSEGKMYTTRMQLEGLANLRSILETKVDVFRKYKLHENEFATGARAKTVKKYRSLQKVAFQNALDAAGRLEKKLLKKYSPLSFKTVFKTDKKFANSLLLTFGVQNYDDLIQKKILDQAVLLWIVRVANKKQYPDVDPHLFPQFIYTMFDQVKETVPVTKQEVLQFAPDYKKLFPALSNAIPEIYAKGDWSPRSFISAGVVSDRLTFVRPANQEVFFLEKKEIAREDTVD